MERAIQKYLEDVIAEEILSGELKKGDIILASYDSKSKSIAVKKSDSKKNSNKKVK